MKQRTLALAFTLGFAALPAWAILPDSIDLDCKFVPASVPNHVKPGAKNVSDGVLSITDNLWKLKICPNCEWEGSGAKWKVSPSHYDIATRGGMKLRIARADGAVKVSITSPADKYYQGGKVESTGACLPSAPADATATTTTR